MEEAIAVLEKRVAIDRALRDGSVESDYDKFCENECLAIEKLINGYRELEEENESLVRQYEYQGALMVNEYFSKEQVFEWFIPKSRIRAKIEEYKQEMKEIRAKKEGLIWNYRLHKLDYAIEVLQELLEE